MTSVSTTASTTASPAVPRQLHFSVEEYRTRLAAVQERMAQHDLAALLLHQPENIAWVSGYWHDGFFAYHSLVVPAAGDPILIERGLEQPVADEMSWVTDLRNYIDGEDPEALAAQALQDVVAEGGRIGVEMASAFLPVTRFQRFNELLPKHSLVSHEDVVEESMRIKSTTEIAYIRQAATIASKAVEAGLAAARVGANELDVAAAIATAQAAHGHDAFMGSPGGTICTGWRTNQLHPQQTDRSLEKGDRIRLELPGIHKQYWAKQMRSSVLGGPDYAFGRTYEILRTAQESGIAAMAPGVPFSHIAELTTRPILNAGLVENYENRIGYGMGIQFHPTSGDFGLDMTGRSTRTLEPGMVFHMLVFAAGAAISETVVVTENGHEVLTSGSRDIPVVG